MTSRSMALASSFRAWARTARWACRHQGKSGRVFVQEPASAKFDSMPRSAIDAGLADVIAAVEALRARSAPISSTCRSSPNRTPRRIHSTERLEKVRSCCAVKRATTFRCTKRTRSIAASSGAWDCTKLARSLLCALPAGESAGGGIAVHDLLIGVTSFFRDPKAWEQLKAEVLPTLLAGRTTNQELRAWIPAAPPARKPILWRSSSKRRLKNSNCQKHHTANFRHRFGSASHREGARGRVLSNIAADVSAKRLERFFVKVERGYQVAKSIREMVILPRRTSSWIRPLPNSPL